MSNDEVKPLGMLETLGVSVADFRSPNEGGFHGDRRDGGLYRYTADIKLGVRIALAVGRPLLVLGPSGCGKSSLAASLARVLERRYYEFVVTSRSEAKDLFYRYDAVRRLGEAHVAAVNKESEINWRVAYPFIEPGPLWWVYSPLTAIRRGAPDGLPGIPPAKDPGIAFALESGAGTDSSTAPSILLIDEIDKADPDFPNNLLVPLGSREFSIEEASGTIQLARADSGIGAPLVVITSNRERDLPAAFLRRCIVLEIPGPTDAELVDIARRTFRSESASDGERWLLIAQRLRELRGRDAVSTAEYLDTVRAIDELKIQDGTAGDWNGVILKTAWSQRDEVGGGLPPR